MVSKAKLYAQLDSLEEELREKLIPHIEAAAAGDNEFVFCVNEFNPHRALKGRIDATTEGLIVLGRQILRLMDKLGEPSDGSLAERICWYCNEWADHHSKGAQGLAARFLEEIRAKQSLS